ncbi:hypothetical protein [Salsipaludibacter albus]|uniref:hypothetical protein n=1 Tax=Salsipaludibacter albus TaxID=2849650 RepID=UPI001EE4259F|nr:hypothetical protein [Salsipaludibacter albus]MBY5162532.1 hypothetical protein [Salsipaludibacter albus]
MTGHEDRTLTRRELVAVILLSVTAILTAWSGFESSKWSGEMSIAFSRASTQRIEAARDMGEANAARQFDLTIFSAYVQARGAGEDDVVAFIEDRFTDHFRVAYDAWLELDPLENPDAPAGPFAMPEYRVPGEADAASADDRADALFATALENNARGDRYTLLTVLFALVLFFAAVSGRLDSHVAGWVVLGLAGALLLTGIGFLISFPVII